MSKHIHFGIKHHRSCFRFLPHLGNAFIGLPCRQQTAEKCRYTRNLKIARRCGRRFHNHVDAPLAKMAAGRMRTSLLLLDAFQTGQ